MSSSRSADYLTVEGDAAEELASAREAAVQRRIADEVAAVVQRMTDIENEALAVWVAMDDTEDDEGWHALASLMWLTHLRGEWMGARMDWRGCKWRGETDGADPVRPEIFSVVDDMEARGVRPWAD